MTRTLAPTAPTSLGPSQQIPCCSPDGKHGGSQQRQNLDHSRTACVHTTRHGPGTLSVHADLDFIPDGKAGPPAARAPGTPRRELICARRGRPAESSTRSTARAVWSGSRRGPRRSGSRVSPPNVTNTLTVKSNMHRRDRLERDLLLSPPPRRPMAATPGQSSGADSNRPFSSPTPVAGSSASRRKTVVRPPFSGQAALVTGAEHGPQYRAGDGPDRSRRRASGQHDNVGPASSSNTAHVRPLTPAPMTPMTRVPAHPVGPG